jgi:hypothetical protein
MRIIIAGQKPQIPYICAQNRRLQKHCTDIVAKTTLFPPYFLDKTTLVARRGHTQSKTLLTLLIFLRCNLKMCIVIMIPDPRCPCMCMQNRRRGRQSPHCCVPNHRWQKHCADIVEKTTLFSPYFLDKTTLVACRGHTESKTLLTLLIFLRYNLGMCIIIMIPYPQRPCICMQNRRRVDSIR